MPEIAMKVFRGDSSGGEFVDYTVEVDEGQVVPHQLLLDAPLLRRHSRCRSHADPSTNRPGNLRGLTEFFPVPRRVCRTATPRG